MFKELNDSMNIGIEDLKRKLRDKMEYNVKMIEQKLTQLHMMINSIQPESFNINNQGITNQIEKIEHSNSSKFDLSNENDASSVQKSPIFSNTSQQFFNMPMNMGLDSGIPQPFDKDEMQGKDYIKTGFYL